MKIQIINGPNLNLLGIREPEVYGTQAFPEFLEQLKAEFPDIQLAYFQSNIEGEIINQLHETGFSYDGILLNAGGYTHTSVAIHDAIQAIEVPVVEIHISNIAAREDFRHTSLLAKACIGTITGLGMDSYRLGIQALVLKQKHQQ